MGAMDMKRKSLVLTLLGVMMMSCGSNAYSLSSDASFENLYFEERTQSICDICIGIKESKYFCISDLFWEIEDSLDNPSEIMGMTVEKITLEDENGKEIKCLTGEMVQGPFSPLVSNSFSEKLPILKVTCKRTFNGKITIKNVRFNLGNEILNFAVDYSLTYNGGYLSYLPLLPSYYPSERAFWSGFTSNPYPWMENMIVGEFIFFDLYQVFKKTNFDCSIKDISIESEHFKTTGSMEYGTVDYSDIWENIQCEIACNPANKYAKGTFGSPLDFKEVVPSDKILYVKLNFEKDVDEMVYTNVVYDMTINGIDYSIKDQFIF